MKTNKIVVGLVVLLVLATSLVSACGGGTSEQPTTDPAVAVDGETLLQERCSECHTLDRVTSAQKTRDGWDQTVTRMVNRGARLNQEEKTVLVDYLAENYGP